jgi:AcrR family transcriptional regulator
VNHNSHYTDPGMRAEKQNSQTRRRQIAAAAMGLIARQGIRGLSVASVARKVGVVPSALYRHYKGKEEILEATLELIRDLIEENVHRVQKESLSPLEQLKLLMMRHLEMIQEFQAIPRIIFSDEVSSSHPLRRTAMYKIIQRILNQVAKLIAEGQHLGQVKPDLNPDTVSVIFLGLVQPPAILWYLSQGKFDVSKHMKKAWPIFEKAIMAEPPLAVFFNARAFKKSLEK